MMTPAGRWGALSLLLLCSLCAPWLRAQEIEEPSGPMPMEDTLPYQRLKYFYEQRSYPTGHIPPGAKQRAMAQFEQMLAQRQAAAAAGDLSAAAASATQWTEIGPRPLKSYTTQYSGRVAALAVDPRDTNVVYLGAADGGVWKTTDGGQNWTALTDGAVTLSIGAIALAPSAPDTVYVGTGEANYAWDNYQGVGVLKSTNGGAFFAQLPDPGFGGYIGSVAVHPQNPSLVFVAATNTGIWRSSDGGSSWTRVQPNYGIGQVDLVMFDPQNFSTVYSVWESGGLFKSTDGGSTWNPINGSGANLLPAGSRKGVGISPSNPAIIYVGRTNGTTSELWKTTDGGQNWYRLANSPDYCTPQCWYDNVVAVHPTNPQVVFAGGGAKSGGIYRSLDGGATWAAVGNGANGVTLHVDHHALVFTPGGDKLYAGNDGGVYSTSNPADPAIAWSNLNNGLGTLQFYPGMALDPTNSSVALGGTQDNGTEHYTGGWLWDQTFGGDGGWAAIDPQTTSTWYVTCQTVCIYKTTDSGHTYNGAQSGIASESVNFIAPLVMDPSNPQTLYFGTVHIWQTVNGAANWMQVGSLVSNSVFTGLAVAPSDTNTVYAVSYNYVYVTRNARSGASATWSNPGAGLPTRAITQVVVDPRVATTAYITVSGFSYYGGPAGSVFRTTDGGASWTSIAGNLPDAPANDLVVDPELPNTLYLATDVGVFQTSNGGASWTPLGSGLPRAIVTSLKMHAGSRLLRIATHGRGMWDLYVPNGRLTASANVLAFGNGYLGLPTASLPVTITNGAAAPVSLSLATSSDFTQTSDCPGSLGVGQSCTAQVAFVATTTGARSGTLSVTGASQGPLTVSLSGTGISGAHGVLSATDLYFATQYINTSSAPQSVTFTNTGNLTLTGITVFSGSTNYQLTSNCPASLAPGANCTGQITFHPLTVTSNLAWVGFLNQGDSGNQWVYLHGVSIAPPLAADPRHRTMRPARRSSPNPANVASALPAASADPQHRRKAAVRQAQPAPAGVAAALPAKTADPRHRAHKQARKAAPVPDASAGKAGETR